MQTFEKSPFYFLMKQFKEAHVKYLARTLPKIPRSCWSLWFSTQMVLWMHVILASSDVKYGSGACVIIFSLLQSNKKISSYSFKKRTNVAYVEALKRARFLRLDSTSTRASFRLAAAMEFWIMAKSSRSPMKLTMTKCFAVGKSEVSTAGRGITGYE